MTLFAILVNQRRTDTVKTNAPTPQASQRATQGCSPALSQGCPFLLLYGRRRSSPACSGNGQQRPEQGHHCSSSPLLLPLPLSFPQLPPSMTFSGETAGRRTRSESPEAGSILAFAGSVAAAWGWGFGGGPSVVACA
jgi:hypothetical protein